MGTIFEVAIAEQEKEYAGRASQAVFQEIDRLEARLTRFNPCSDIGQINNLRPGRIVRIGFETYECLKTAEEIRSATAGSFDVNFRARRVNLKSDRFRNGRGNPGYELLSGPDGFAVRLPDEREDERANPVQLDLGGIGKGFALDRARAVLLDWEVDRALIHSGTSTAIAMGSAPGFEEAGGGWPVGAGGFPAIPGVARRILLKDRALSGSGTEVRGRHIVDPRTGEPAESHLAAWVSHPCAAFADALSTAFMVMPTDEVEKYCRLHGEVWALVITKNGKPMIYNTDILFSPPSRSDRG